MELTRKAVRDRIKKLAPTKSVVLENWDYYRGDLARPPYFPYLHEETDLEYKRRTKIVVGYPGAIINRTAAYFRKEPIVYDFSVNGERVADRAKEAADVWAALSQENNYPKLGFDLARDAGVGGEAYVKPRYVRFEGYTGQEIALGVGNWKGRVSFDRISQAFIYRIRDFYRQTFVEAWARINGQTKLITEGMVQDAEEYIEVIRPPWYNEQTGELSDSSARVIWQDEEEIYRAEILYDRPPLIRFANLVSRPESEDGIADLTPLKPLANAINHIVSGSTRAIEYHGWPQMVFIGTDPEDIKRGTDQAIVIPPAGDGTTPQTVDLLTWDQNLEGAKSLYTNLADIMASVAGIPKSLIYDMEGAGKVPSGVALRLMYENLNTLCGLKEAGFQRAEENLIKTSLEMMAYHNGRPGYFDEVEVAVEYNPDRTPRDRSAELEEAMKEKLLMLKNIVDIVIENVPDVNNRDEAIQYIEVRAEEDRRVSQLKGGIVPPQIPGDEGE